MSLVSTLAALSLVAFAILRLWRLLRRYILKSPLDALPGPSSKSFLQGNIIRRSTTWISTDYEVL